MISDLAKRIAQLRNLKPVYQAYDTEKQFPYYIPSGKPARTHMIDAIPLPQPDVNPADCLDLLRYLLSRYISITIDTFSKRHDRGVVVWLHFGRTYKGEADTLEQVIAKAACEALEAVQGQQQGETT